MGSCMSCSQTAAKEPAGASSSRARSGSQSWKARKKLQEQEGAKGEGGGGGGRWPAAVSVFGDVREDELHRLPDRLFLNGATEAACLYTQQGKKGTNQDAMIVWENFMLRSDTIFCGVFDGHGPFGHMVSKKVRDSLPLKLSDQWRANFNGNKGPHQFNSMSGGTDSVETTSITIDDEFSDSLDVDENETLPAMYLPLKKSILKAFKIVDKELKFNPTIDCFCSGTTAVTVVKQGRDLVIGNLGDSRAVMGTRDKHNNLIAVELTVDLKPNLPREAARIQQCKGRVFALQDEPEVARVWLPNSDSPGLAMARAFGDFCLKDYGLISVPDISYRHLTDKDEFIILATDGVWDVLSNKEAVDIIASAPTRGTAARALVDCAVRAWRLKFPTSKIDDCAVVCLYLDNPSSSDQSQTVHSKKSPIQPAVSTAVVIDDSIAGGAQVRASPLECSHTLLDANEIVPVSEVSRVPRVAERSQSSKSLADCISATEDEEWSALEGVTRVNSLLNLPRFLSGDKGSTSRKKWF
ncbi:probable protein phosphatase 2C 66 [Musa acuminata AAA Group]|uniref:probable protein phosphatase 2C 66 n=1 Tax=Musa acuminata AAA Group TaxID=214697 RepID=UPI0031D4A9C5